MLNKIILKDDIQTVDTIDLCPFLREKLDAFSVFGITGKFSSADMDCARLLCLSALLAVALATNGVDISMANARESTPEENRGPVFMNLSVKLTMDNQPGIA